MVREEVVALWYQFLDESVSDDSRDRSCGALVWVMDVLAGASF